MNFNRLSRRQFLQLTGMAGGAVVLAACAPTAPAAPGCQQAAKPLRRPQRRTPVTYWYAWGNLDPAMDKIIATDEFKEHMGGAPFEYKGNTTQDAMLTAVAAGTPPDGGSNYNYVELFTRGATIDVTDMVNASTVIKGDDLLEGLWHSAFWDGKMMGVPGIEGYLWWGLNVNTDAAAKGRPGHGDAAQDLGRSFRLAQGVDQEG